MSTYVDQTKQIFTGVQVVQTADPSKTVGVSPLLANQVVGNDSSGNVSVANLVAGSNMDISQSGNEITFASTATAASGAKSWIASPQDVSGSEFFTVPITQVTTSLTDTLPYSTTHISMISGYSQTVSSLASDCAMNIDTNFQTDASLDNAPLAIVFAVYVGSGFSSPVNGTLPIATISYTLPSTSSAAGTYQEYFARLVAPFTPTETTFTLVLVPFFYVPAGSTISGTNMTQGNSYSSSYYNTISNLYDTVYPESSNAIKTSQISLTATNLENAIPYGGLSVTSSLQVLTGTISYFGSPSNTSIRLKIPVYFNNITTITQLTFRWGIALNGAFIASGSTTYNTANHPYIYDTISFDLQPEVLASDSSCQVFVSYQTNNAQTVLAYLARVGVYSLDYVQGSYGSYLTDYSTATGPLSLTDNKQTTAFTASSVSLPTTVSTLNYFPPSNTGSAIALTAANAVDTIVITPDYDQTQLNVTFNFSFLTDAYSTAPASELPNILVVMATTQGSGGTLGSLQEMGMDIKMIPNTTASTTVCDNISVEGRINVFEPSVQISVYAFIVANSNAADITCTNFSSIVQGGGTAFTGAGCSWVVKQQSVTLGSGGGSGGSVGITSVETASGSYLSATTTSTVATIDTEQATPTAAGIVTLDAATESNKLLQMGPSGAIGCDITSSDGTVTVNTSEGNIDLSSPIATSGYIGIYSPVNFDRATIPSDVVVSAIYTTTTPDLSVMQTITSASVVCKYGDGSAIAGTVDCNIIFGFYTTNTSELALQPCLYVSTLGTTAPVYPTSIIQQGSCSVNTFDNYSTVNISYQVPSVQGESITYTLGCSTLSGLTTTIDASSFTMVVSENVPDTQSIVSSQSYSVSSPVTVINPYVSSSGSTYINTTSLFSGSIAKVYDNSSFLISGYLPIQATTSGTGTFGEVYLYLGNLSLSTSLVTGFQSSGMIGEGITAISTGVGNGVLINYIIPDYFIDAGVYQIAMGGTYLSSGSQYSVLGGSITVSEILPLADGGVIQNFSLGSTSTSTTPYTSTLSPEYQNSTPVGSWFVENRAPNSLCTITARIIQNSGANAPEGQCLFSLYADNLATSTPIVSFRATSPSNAGGIYNARENEFQYSFVPTAVATGYTFYLGVNSLTTTNTTQSISINGQFVELYNGSILTIDTLSTVVAEGGSYLTASTSGSTATIGTQQATTTQAGLLAMSTATAANSLIQMGSSTPVPCALTSSDNTVTITPSSGSIDLSSPLKISAGVGSFVPVLNNQLNVSSIYPFVNWTADYINGGVSSGSITTIYDSTAQVVAVNGTATGSQLNLSEYTRFTATAASPPSADNTATPQWIAVIQPASVTNYKLKSIELIITPFLGGAGATQAQNFAKDGFYRYLIGANMTGLGLPPTFTATTLFPLNTEAYGQSGTPTVADTPPWFTFAVVPAASSPSPQFTTGDVLVIYAQWILSTTTGVVPSFDLAFRTLT